MGTLRESITATTEAFEADKIHLSKDDLQAKYLSPAGIIRKLFKTVDSLECEDAKVLQEEQKALGPMVEQLRGSVEYHLRSLVKQNSEGTQGSVDITRQPYGVDKGTMHPLNIIMKEACLHFERMGFTIIDGPEIETTEYCFDKLRTPSWHPARDSQDSFFIEGNDDLVLRTHTTAIQARLLETEKPPIRAVSLGKVFRVDTADTTHSPVFHQIEGLMIDEGITFANLKAVLTDFVKSFAGVKDVRFRPHYFSYTEPSAELDVLCSVCEGGGCGTCGGDGWIELLGCGMVHPELIDRVKGDSDKEYTGFAFGLGIERLAMQRYGIPDIRDLYKNDLHMLRQITK